MLADTNLLQKVLCGLYLVDHFIKKMSSFIPEIINLKFNQNIQEFLTLFWGEVSYVLINTMKKVITTDFFYCDSIDVYVDFFAMNIEIRLFSM